jgi:hypothetical protein
MTKLLCPTLIALQLGWAGCSHEAQPDNGAPSLGTNQLPSPGGPSAGGGAEGSSNPVRAEAGSPAAAPSTPSATLDAALAGADGPARDATAERAAPVPGPVAGVTDAGAASPSTSFASYFAFACATVPVEAGACTKVGQICRLPGTATEPTGAACTCTGGKLWSCSTPCPAAVFTGDKCAATYLTCAIAPPAGGPPTGEFCGCGNHQSWDCVRLCTAEAVVGQKCNKRSGFSTNENNCFRPRTAARNEEICSCMESRKWDCGFSCAPTVVSGADCDQAGLACVHIATVMAWIHERRACVCGPDKKWTCTNAD